jgi:hypothetical protein
VAGPKKPAGTAVVIFCPTQTLVSATRTHDAVGAGAVSRANAEEADCSVERGSIARANSVRRLCKSGTGLTHYLGEDLVLAAERLLRSGRPRRAPTMRRRARVIDNNVVIVLRGVGVMLVLGGVSWGIGLLTYQVSLWLFFHETPSREAWLAVLFWSGLVFLLALPFPLWFFTLTLHERISGPRRIVVVPLIVAMTALVPTTLLTGIWEGAAGRFSPEFFLFCVLFAVAAAAFALAFELIADRLI